MFQYSDIRWNMWHWLHLCLYLSLMFQHLQIAQNLFSYTTNIPVWSLKDSWFPHVYSVINCAADDPKTDLPVSSNLELAL